MHQKEGFSLFPYLRRPVPSVLIIRIAPVTVIVVIFPVLIFSGFILVFVGLILVLVLIFIRLVLVFVGLILDRKSVV